MHLRSFNKEAFLRAWPSLALILLAFSIQLLLATRSLDFLLTNVLPDDAFYYFQIARNIVHGFGVTFDGVEPTNGFHPLWMLILMPIFSMFSNGSTMDIAPIKIVLILCSLLSLGTTLTVWRLIARLTKKKYIQAFSVAVFALNPFFLFETLNGLETSLALFLVAQFFLLSLSFRKESSLSKYVVLGLVGGLMVVARLDMAFYLAAYLLWLLWQVWGNAERVRNAVLAGVAACVVIAPWCIWNAIHFKMLLTSAAGGNSLVTHALIVQDHGASFAQYLKAVVYLTDYQIRLLFLHTGSPAFFLALLGATGALLATKHLSFPQKSKEVSPVFALFMGFVALFIVNVVIRFWGANWYFVSFGIFVSLLTAVVLNTLVPLIRYKTVLVLLLAGFVSFAFFVSWSKEIRDRYALQIEMLAAADWTNTMLPQDAVVGAFNAGIQGYFSRVRVVNLDGLVNNSAYYALKDRQTLSYIERTGITHVIDFDIYLTYRYRSFFGPADYMDHLLLLKRIGVRPNSRSQDGISVYTVQATP